MEFLRMVAIFCLVFAILYGVTGCNQVIADPVPEVQDEPVEVQTVEGPVLMSEIERKFFFMGTRKGYERGKEDVLNVCYKMQGSLLDIQMGEVVYSLLCMAKPAGFELKEEL